jgi:AcrR family transcriptional regulator
VSSTSTPNRPAYHHGDLHQALLDEGLRLIQEKGVHGLTLRELGSRLKVSRTAPYRHFADKDALLAAICQTGFERFAAALAGALDHAGPEFPARLQALELAYLRFASENRSHYEAMFGSGFEGENPEQWKTGESARSFQILVDLVREGQRSGYVRDGDAVLIATVIWSAVHGISALRIFPSFEPGTPGWQYAKLSCDIFAAGLRANAVL